MSLRRGLVEGGLHYPNGTLQTYCYVLWLLQCSPHIPGIHKPHLCRHACWKMAHNLYGHFRNPYQRWPPSPPQENSMSPPTTLRTWPHHETLQNCLQHLQNGVLGNDHWTRQSGNGWEETQCHSGLGTPYHCEYDQIIPWIHQLLSEIHSELLQYCSTLEPPDKNKPWNWTLLQQQAFEELKHIFSFYSGTTNPWCYPTLLYYNRCFAAHGWSDSPLN